MTPKSEAYDELAEKYHYKKKNRKEYTDYQWEHIKRKNEKHPPKEEE